MGRPNILFIITHDTGTHLGCYGWPVETSNIDLLASEGVRFDNHFCTAPQCSPSRVGIITGCHPHEHGVMGLCSPQWGFKLPDNAATLPKVLHEADYTTHIWGFQHENWNDPKALGYDYDHIPHEPGEVPKFLASYITPRLCNWLKEKPAEPWFATVGFFETHIPYRSSPHTTQRLKKNNILPYLPDHPGIRKDMADFYSSVGEVDHCVGQILNALKESGEHDNTIVVFTTDHGIAMPRAKCSLYDPGLKASLLMRWPGKLSENRIISDLMSNIDLMPTLLELCGVDVPDSVKGQSMAGLLLGGTYTPRREIMAELTYHTIYDPTRCIRTNRYKFIRHWQPAMANLQPEEYFNHGAGGEFMRRAFDFKWPERELYDLSYDPYEQHNLFGSFGTKQRSEELEQRLLEWMEQTGDPLLYGPVSSPQQP